jgi:hypothetical protein
MKRPPTYRSLMASAGIGRLSTDEAFLRTGILIDMCGAPRRKAGIARALAWCDKLEARDLSAAERGQLDYFRANAWNTRRPRPERRCLVMGPAGASAGNFLPAPRHQR